MQNIAQNSYEMPVLCVILVWTSLFAVYSGAFNRQAEYGDKIVQLYLSFLVFRIAWFFTYLAGINFTFLPLRSLFWWASMTSALVAGLLGMAAALEIVNTADAGGVICDDGVGCVCRVSWLFVSLNSPNAPFLHSRRVLWRFAYSVCEPLLLGCDGKSDYATNADRGMPRWCSYRRHRWLHPRRWSPHVRHLELEALLHASSHGDDPSSLHGTPCGGLLSTAICLDVKNLQSSSLQALPDRSFLIFHVFTCFLMKLPKRS
jgi:uncharacterized MAPEG superfamily protein